MGVSLETDIYIYIYYTFLNLDLDFNLGSVRKSDCANGCNSNRKPGSISFGTRGRDDPGTVPMVPMVPMVWAQWPNVGCIEFAHLRNEEFCSCFVEI